MNTINEFAFLRDDALATRLAALGVRVADCEERFVLGSGPGGQKVNKTSSTVQLSHRPSGLEIRMQRERSQTRNRELAWAELAARLEGRPGISALEINISCPNVKEGGIEFGSNPEAAAKVVSAVRKASTHTLITKLSPTVADVKAIARTIRYTVNLAGADHVALGSDFDGTVKTPFDASGVARITEALLNEKFSEEDIRKIMGENVARVLRETLPKE